MSKKLNVLIILSIVAILAWRVALSPPPISPYKQANRELGPPRPGETRVVFIGDSITLLWGGLPPGSTPFPSDFFPGKSYLNRGFGGQTTTLMLRRFSEDVVALKPSVVVLLGGTNDIAEKGGNVTLEAIEGNLASMCEMAQVNGIGVVLCSLLPVGQCGSFQDTDAVAKVRALNAWIERYSQLHSCAFVDYYSHMVDGKGGLRSELQLRPGDVHTNRAGYEIMAPLVEAGIAKALKH